MSTTREFTAKHRFARITARKAGLIANLIRGRSVNDALETLQFTPNRGAAFYLKIVKSAVANASQDEAVNVNRLYISDARADVGPLLNDRMRFRPGPQGRAMPFAKRLSHLTIKVRTVDDDVGDALESESDSTVTGTKKKASRKKAASAPKGAKAKAAKPAGAAKKGTASKAEKSKKDKKA
jgi:large subunit ribosomal protein L22